MPAKKKGKREIEIEIEQKATIKQRATRNGGTDTCPFHSPDIKQEEMTILVVLACVHTTCISTSKKKTKKKNSTLHNGIRDHFLVCMDTGLS